MGCGASLEEAKALLAAQGVDSGPAQAAAAPKPGAKTKSKKPPPYYPVDIGVPLGLECTDEVLAKIDEWMSGGICSFDDDKLMVIKCSVQSYVFTTEQAAELIKKMTWDDKQLEVCELFKDRLLNPEDGGPLLDLLGDFPGADGNKDKCQKMLDSCKKARIMEWRDYPIEEGRLRDDGEVDRFLEELDGAGLESKRMEVVENEIKDRPDPPFTCDQFKKVLEKFTFGDEAAKVAEKICEIEMVYPIECEPMVELWKEANWQWKDKLGILEAMKPIIKDRQNKAMLVAHFEFPSDKSSAEEILRDCYVEYIPDEYPDVNIQNVFMSLYPSAYGWRKVWGGYRCMFGGFFVPDWMMDEKIVEFKGGKAEEPEHREVIVEHREVTIDNDDAMRRIKEAEEQGDRRAAQAMKDMGQPVENWPEHLQKYADDCS
mmetsp:Transcript_62797/g.99587  ORF Transcript_62797/g.99587 Transcript_62797/m.99587 type:complete len:429 (+) Transcript_62797:61-1347(+)